MARRGRRRLLGERDGGGVAQTRARSESAHHSVLDARPSEVRGGGRDELPTPTPRCIRRHGGRRRRSFGLPTTAAAHARAGGRRHGRPRRARPRAATTPPSAATAKRSSSGSASLTPPPLSLPCRGGIAAPGRRARDWRALDRRGRGGPLRRRARICVTVGAAARAPVGGVVGRGLAPPMPVPRADRNSFGLEHSPGPWGGHTAPCGGGDGAGPQRHPFHSPGCAAACAVLSGPADCRARARRAGPPAGHLQRGAQSRTPPRGGGGPSTCCACTQRWLRVHPETRDGERLQVDFGASRRLGGQPAAPRAAAAVPDRMGRRHRCGSRLWRRRGAAEAAAEPPPSPLPARCFAATVLGLTRDHVTTGWRACRGSSWPTASAGEESGVDQEMKQRQPSGRKGQRRRGARGGGLATSRGPRCKSERHQHLVAWWISGFHWPRGERGAQKATGQSAMRRRLAVGRCDLCGRPSTVEANPTVHLAVKEPVVLSGLPHR